ncbi:anhydro-N-acetylmuramic acid kinase [Niveibacterium sp. 24ML]|uniref:anhydro-N-acetylmuramic acid kinase n=1 Tax=Niveibacterium sp. 24ML TaxID=2985512 RepID=UPI0022715FD7|nr:anhydro-N-acetylmuramic acid kinase [Niveibacterium sp. 24ML]MCX9158437.1 anhydro-N-acetylmuramic acid kinase [Niveibacterium sp. 24ML]
MSTPGALFAGLMSGTSLDGVDAVVADFSTPHPRIVSSAFVAYPAALRQDLLSLNAAGHDELHRSAGISVKLAHLYAQATQDALSNHGLTADQICAVGCHGQTVRHQPALGYSLQLNHPALLAELTGITVVADFRNRDIAAGGQGAPLVPAFHDQILRAADEHRVVLNIGGISNVTDLAPGRPTRGFDTGPGNMLLDAWAARHLGTPFDAGGRWAAQGRLDAGLLARLLDHPFLALAAPKSCGREEFNLDWLDTQLPTGLDAADVQATLLELTARSIVDATLRECGAPQRLLVCGGGVHNATLMSRLGALLPGSKVVSTAEFGVSPDYLEALAFAWLARCCITGTSGNLPQVTGARGPRVLGAIYPA